MISSTHDKTASFFFSIQENDLFRQLIEAMPYPIYSCSADGTLLSFNKAAAKLWGREPRPAEEKWCGSHRIFSSDGRLMAPDECPLARLLKGNEPSDTEIIVERPDGSRVLVQTAPALIYDASGAVAGAIDTLTDITEAKTAEAHSSMLSAIIQSSNDAIVSKTLEGIITSWNPAAERLFGYKSEEMIGESILKIIPHDRLEEEPQILMRIRQGEIVDHFETIRRTKSGELINISLTISPVTDSHHKIIGVSKIARDITAQKTLHQSFLESEERFKVIANSAPVMIWMSGTQGELQFINRNFIDFLGEPEIEIMAYGWDKKVHPEDIQRSNLIYENSFARQSNFFTEFRLKNFAGEYKWIKCTGVPRFTNEGFLEGYIGACMDISLIKDHEQRKDDFIKMASHELKTPVTSIKGYIQLLLSHSNNEKNPFIHSSLSIVDRQVSNLTKLINDLLDLTRIDSGQIRLQKENFQLSDLALEVISQIKTINPAYNIEYIQKKDTIVFADRDKISQVLINYLTNALKYSSTTATVFVTIDQQEKEAIVKVEDHGIGISPEDQPRIFERFYRVEGKQEATYPGFGIGLFIVQEIIRTHQGRTWVESEKDKGSRFYFSIPLI